MNRRNVLLGAALLDALFGEPRRAHPVRAMGAYLRQVRRLRTGYPQHDRLIGAASVIAGALLAWAVARRASAPGRTLLRAMVLKPAFAMRALLEAGASVRAALAAGDLPTARSRLGRDLVSRPVIDLEPHEVAAACIESLAENLTDSVVAPLLAAALCGTEAAWLYRFINTADAMLGYRTAELRDLGLVPAHVDDLANLVPARLATLLIVCAAPAGGGDVCGALRVALRDHDRTDSPNAGWTMAAMAGALGVRLSKRGAYTLNESGRAAEVEDITRALRIVAAACALDVALSAACAGP
jgi:adenosylcobinamide-phosphate synthase